MQDFVKSERLSRKLAYLVAKKLSLMINDMIASLASETQMKLSQSVLNNQEALQVGPRPFINALQEYMLCPQHRDTIVQLSCILQVVSLDCPTALVWSGIGENRPGVLSGSPLDYLPISPSSLPMPEKSPKSNQEYRIKLEFAEQAIKHRSQQAE